MNRSNIANDWQEALIDKPDFLKQAVQALVQKALEEAFGKFIGADEGQNYLNATSEAKKHGCWGLLDFFVPLFNEPCSP
jgi:hypothetical protein